ncbi:MAG: hypothetical protein WCI59_20900 [Betaproteobacteria bacterium]|jgi:hypothetical protein
MSFLFLKKKKPKKLHPFGPILCDWQTDESFLVLFFKKERLSYCTAANICRRSMPNRPDVSPFPGMSVSTRCTTTASSFGSTTI